MTMSDEKAVPEGIRVEGDGSKTRTAGLRSPPGK
jgi:hypothetical protein